MRSSACYARNAIAGPQSDERTFPRNQGNCVRSGYPHGRINCCKKWCALLLNAYYEPQFSPHSHGFRPHRGCHTALGEVTKHWRGVKWFIEGDISQCFDRIDHPVLLSILNEKLHDQRFLRLLANLLDAGYLEDWNYHATLSGSPQGGIVTPPTMLQNCP